MDLPPYLYKTLLNPFSLLLEFRLAAISYSLDDCILGTNTENLPCGAKFSRVLIFAIFAVFFAIRKNRFPQNKITANFFSAKIYSTVEIIYKNTGLKGKKMP